MTCDENTHAYKRSHATKKGIWPFEYDVVVYICSKCGTTLMIDKYGKEV